MPGECNVERCSKLHASSVHTPGVRLEPCPGTDATAVWQRAGQARITCVGAGEKQARSSCGAAGKLAWRRDHVHRAE
jgi:hypothetical protein